MTSSTGYLPLTGARNYLPSAPGVYALSRDGQIVHYVGRSDSNLASRVLSSAAEGRGYRYFWFAQAANAVQAYRWECDLYHQYINLDNLYHPAAPAGTGLVCSHPSCSIFSAHSALSLLLNYQRRG